MARANDKNNFSILNKTKGRLATLPFVDMKNTVLGKKYSLSLVFAGDALIKRLNRTYRQKDKTANILSFSLSKDEGEIFINLGMVKREAPKFGKSAKNYLGFLFIHGLLHLKGMTHSSTMERQEIKFLNKFGF